ncbi:flavin-dependent thymidylate synthase-like [Pelobates fuscus]|uniref:flavin-dependent thymidylate synthase-like n=1 Tax=Pelobates fuscus TaxID=191477 RepID=UPI002FE4EDA1
MTNKATFCSDMSVDLVRCLADDDIVIDSARVSTNTVGADTDVSRFIDFLVRDRHGSPFEHCVFTFALDVPIFVAREIMRHRIASYSEESGRYTASRLKFYLLESHRPLVQAGKPGDYKFTPGSQLQIDYASIVNASTCVEAAETYQAMLDDGIAREVARMVLPVSTYTRIHMTINARSLMNFLSLRHATKDSWYKTSPLYEIELVAKQMEQQFKEFMPHTHAAFIEHGRIAP